MEGKRKEELKVFDIYCLKEGGISDKFRKNLFEGQAGRVIVCLIDFEELQGEEVGRNGK